MSDDFGKLATSDLPIALYLNQRLTFDLLAALENGFSHFSTLQTSSTGRASEQTSTEAKLGFSNIFALVGVSFGGGRSRTKDEAETESSTEKIVHTPTSLFARLRRELHSREMVHQLSSASDLATVSPGDFIEFEARLRPSPLVEVLTAMVELFGLMESFGSGPPRTKQAKSKTGDVRKQIKSLLAAVTAAGSRDLIAEMEGMRGVLTVEEDYFIDPTMNDVIDGTFRVLGKATRTVNGADDVPISLLRKTSLGKFRDLAPLLEQMGHQLDQSIGFHGSIESEISGPAVQLIPLAIFA